jgi:hypothetical protein
MLLERSLDSLVLSVERFNCPWDRGRQEVMLLLLDRAFELLMKAAILHRGGRIRERGQRETFGHDKCVRVCLSDEKAKCLSTEQALTIQIVNSLRDAAQHYMLEVSEQQLYLYALGRRDVVRRRAQNGVLVEHPRPHPRACTAGLHVGAQGYPESR